MSIKKIRTTTITTAERSARAGIYVPFVRLRGLWLHEAGFTEHMVLEVEVQDEQIILRKTKKHWVESRGKRTLIDA